MTRRDNNFDLLRLLAALGVLVSHAWSLTIVFDEPLSRITHGRSTIGTLCVGVFFTISGYLISQSLDRSPGIGRFVRARLLRLLPALIVCVLVLAFVAGPVLSSLPPEAYFRDPLPYRYAFFNISLIKTIHELPGVFVHNPFQRMVNGSLWTLPEEARCYLLVLLLGLAGRRARWLWLAALIGLAVLKLAGHAWPASYLYSFFAAGAVLYHWRVPLNGKMAAVSVAALAATLFIGGFEALAALPLAYAVLWLALKPRLPSLSRFGDPSYGIYIWAYPVEQVAASLGTSFVAEVAVCLPIAVAFGYASFHLIEKPALRLKDGWPRRLAVSPA